MWELIFWIVLYFLAAVGFGFIVALICMFISDWWDERKLKRAFENTKARKEVIKNAELAVLDYFHAYCRQCLLTVGKLGTDNNSAYCMGARDATHRIMEHIDKYYEIIKEKGQ